MGVLIPVVLLAWAWAVIAFARWRSLQLAEESRKEANLPNDWAMQFFLKGTGLFLLGLILLGLIVCQ